jgi:hypothetical protein
MKSLVVALLISTFAAVPAGAQDPGGSAVTAVAGKYLYDAKGHVLSTIMKVSPSGSAQIILEDRLRTIPGSTISLTDGKLTTSLSKREILKLR